MKIRCSSRQIQSGIYDFSFTTEKDDGETIYEAEVILSGKEYEVEVAASGKLLSKILESEDGGDDDDEEEVEVQLSDCPKAVQKTLKRESKGGELEEISKETEGNRVVYEAEVEFGDDEYEVEVASDGTLLSKILEGDDDDQDDEE